MVAGFGRSLVSAGVGLGSFGNTTWVRSAADEVGSGSCGRSRDRLDLGRGSTRERKLEEEEGRRADPESCVKPPDSIHERDSTDKVGPLGHRPFSGDGRDRSLAGRDGPARCCRSRARRDAFVVDPRPRAR